MNSLEIRETKMKLIDMVNGIPLPLEVKRLILQDVISELNATTEREINLLLEERTAAEAKAQEAGQKASEIAENAQGRDLNAGSYEGKSVPSETK